MLFFLHIYFLLILFFLFVLLFLLNFKGMHPLLMGGFMVIYSIMISLSLNMFNFNSFYSFLMFLIVVGGFLILFLYFNSFAINNKILFSYGSWLIFLLNILLVILFIYIFVYKFNLFNLILFINNKLYESLSMFFSLKLSNYNIDLLYMKMFNLTLFSMLYLMFSLLIVTKMIYFCKPKSLRQLI